MNFFDAIRVERKKIHRSKIVLILVLAAIVLWVPSMFNMEMNLDMQAGDPPPENNFFVQGFLLFAWFLFPAGMVVATVMIRQLEQGNNGISKMLSLPVHPAMLSLAKFIILVFLAALFILITIGVYYIAAAVGTVIHHYNFMLAPLFVFKVAAFFFLAAIPMLSVFWMLSVCIQTPIFAAGLGLASVVPSVLMINTKLWFIYPMCYPFYVITAKYISTAQVNLFPWIPVAVGITIVCLAISCIFFGKAERR
ncbi:ABC transporter permease [Oceanobacillus neutriphilus]|uniref:ABC transporter permease n=1 Tax=Oceanobacillus neutriphilus TaxID=531815 RepID=A0ABQ2P1T7_9BACI|nr:ABC transporter permease [Oceanobacillus neutriphilus]GGP15958.1 hypothetical protein GCM10011346_45860 [Oceanobacillus neutriphilus]